MKKNTEPVDPVIYEILVRCSCIKKEDPATLHARVIKNRNGKRIAVYQCVNCGNEVCFLD